MTAASEITCAKTGLHLVKAAGEMSYRIAKDKNGGLKGYPNKEVGSWPDSLGSADPRGRFDTRGSTIYLADNRRCAYAEVLTGFRKERAATAAVTESLGIDPEEFIERVEHEAEENEVDCPWAISVDWQMDRSIYEIRLPRSGWWVQINHADTLAALQRLAPGAPGLTANLRALTGGDVMGEQRSLTTHLAQVIREQYLDDGSQPLGIFFGSKTLLGNCWAYWDRRMDEGLGPGSNDLWQSESWNVGPDPAFQFVAKHYDLPILKSRRSL